MCDLVTPTIKLISACINKYTDFCAFKDECVTFRQSLCNVREVLEDVQREIAEGPSSGSNTRLRRPMELLQAATVEGGEVLRKCSTKRTLLAFVFSRQLMGMLNKAKADIEEAMRLLQVSSVRIQVSTRRVMDCVSDRLDELHKQINASYTSKHEVADLIRAEMQQHRESQGGNIAVALSVALSDALVKMGVVSSAQDCADQLAELQREADSIRKAKVIYDEEVLEAVKALTAPREEDPTAASLPGLEPPLRQGSETSSAVQECMICPISGEVMRDPVTVLESGLTYDRKSLCTSLLLYPDLEPGTGQRFDHSLHYTPNIAVRTLIMAQHGDSYYQKYDDTEFKEQYEVKWKEMGSPTTVVASDFGSGCDSHWSAFEAESAFAEPASATAIHSGWGGGDPTDLFGGSNDPFGGSCFGDIGAFSGSKAGKSDGEIPGVTFGDSEETVRIDTMSSHADADEMKEAAKPRATAQFGNRCRACCCSRRAKWLVAGTIIVVLVVIVVVAVGASKRSPATAVERFNSTLPPYTTESLQDTSSPQYRAYEWVTQSDQVPEDDDETRLFRMTQRFALATLLYSLGRDSWIRSTESECEWGPAPSNITCTADLKIVGLDPDAAGDVPSPIPREIGLLTNLVHLSLTSNSLTSSIPTELGLLSALEKLRLDSNSLSSSIPTELAQLSALTYLRLAFNDLTSSIPTELGQLAFLSALELNDNSLNSSIPTELAQLFALTWLSLSNNSLTSSIPTELGRLSNLETLDLYENRLTGTVPSAVCSIDFHLFYIDCAEVTCSCCSYCEST